MDQRSSALKVTSKVESTAPIQHVVGFRIELRHQLDKGPNVPENASRTSMLPPRRLGALATWSRYRLFVSEYPRLYLYNASRLPFTLPKLRARSEISEHIG